ncbi:MAG: hypothetical protein IPO91_34325 [Chloroflexi bacterium]|nr:hypothetical protein [Chloroflexota bacterium]
MRMEKRFARLKAAMDQRALSIMVWPIEFAQFVLWLALAPLLEIVRLRMGL